MFTCVQKLELCVEYLLMFDLNEIPNNNDGVLGAVKG